MSNKKINLIAEKVRRKENLELLKSNHVYSENMEHDACGVGLVSSTDGKKSRKVVPDVWPPVRTVVQPILPAAPLSPRPRTLT